MMVTELHHERWVLSSSLMDQELIHSPNVTPSGYPMKFWGLFGEVGRKEKRTLGWFC